MIFFHLYQFIPQFVPTSPSMGEYGEGDPTSCVLFLSPALPGYCELGPGYGWQVKKDREDQGVINRTWKAALGVYRIRKGVIWGVYRIRKGVL